MKKLIAIIGAFAAGGLPIVVSNLGQSASAALTVNYYTLGAMSVKKLQAIISAFAAGGVSIVVSSFGQSVNAALTAN